MIQLAKCPRCLRKVYPGTRNGKKFAYDYFVNRDGEITSWLPHNETCPFSPSRDPINGRLNIRDYADVIDDLRMVWKLDCAVLEPRDPIDWDDVNIHLDQTPARHINPVTYKLVKPGGPYPKGNRAELATSFVGTVVNSEKKTVVALMVARQLFDKVHDFLYQYDSRNCGKVELKQVVVAGYRLILDSTQLPISRCDIRIPPDGTPENESLERYAMEKDLLGFYVSGHPMEAYRDIIRDYATANTEILSDYHNGTEVSIVGMITQTEELITSKENALMLFTVEDLKGIARVYLLPSLYRIVSTLSEGQIVYVKGIVKHSGIRSEKTVIQASEIMDIKTLIG